MVGLGQSATAKHDTSVAWNEEGQIMPAASKFMDLSMALVSGVDKEKSRPLGGEVPGRRSTVQSYGQCGGSEVARALLNTSFKSWYSDGTPERSGNSLRGERLEASDGIELRQTA